MVGRLHTHRFSREGAGGWVVLVDNPVEELKRQENKSKPQSVVAAVQRLGAAPKPGTKQSSCVTSTRSRCDHWNTATEGPRERQTSPRDFWGVPMAGVSQDSSSVGPDVSRVRRTRMCTGTIRLRSRLGAIHRFGWQSMRKQTMCGSRQRMEVGNRDGLERTYLLQ